MKIIRKRELAKLLDISYSTICLIFDSDLKLDKFRYNGSKFKFIYSVKFLEELKDYLEKKMNNTSRTGDKYWYKIRVQKLEQLIKNFK